MDHKKININKRQQNSLIFAYLFLLLFTQLSIAQKETDTIQAQFGGPASVQGQIEEDAKQKESLSDLGALKKYFDWKKDFA